MRISRRISGDITPIKIQAALRDHEFILEGMIDDENIYYNNGQHTYLSSSKVVDLPSESNGVYGDKFLLDYASASFYDDVWLKLAGYAKETHLYRKAKGAVEISDIETIKGGAGGAEGAARMKDGQIVIKKPPEWKLLWAQSDNLNGAPQSIVYDTKRSPLSFPALTLSFRAGKKVELEAGTANAKGITRIERVVEETPEQLTIDFSVSFRDIDKEDEYVYFYCEVLADFEKLL